MKHPISEFWKFIDFPYKTVDELKHDVKNQIQLTTEELRQLRQETEKEQERITQAINEDERLPDSNAVALTRSSYYNSAVIQTIDEVLGDST